MLEVCSNGFESTQETHQGVLHGGLADSNAVCLLHGCYF